MHQPILKKKKDQQVSYTILNKAFQNSVKLNFQSQIVSVRGKQTYFQYKNRIIYVVLSFWCISMPTKKLCYFIPILEVIHN